MSLELVPTLTKHGVQKLKKRHGLKKSLHLNVVKSALNRGVSLNNLKGSLHKHITHLSYMSKFDNTFEVKIFNNYIFIFRGFTFITTYKLDRKYVDKVKSYLIV